MSKVIALNFSSPLQSWAGKSLVKTRVDTESKPKERAIKGLLAACFGIHRDGVIPDIIKDSVVTVDVLQKGQVVRDFQIIGNREDEKDFLTRIGRILNRGAKTPLKTIISDNAGGNSIVRRTYLAEAQFLVFIAGKDDSETLEIYEKLRNPVWSPYLGRKAFAPTFPFILGLVDSENKVSEAKSIIEKVNKALSESEVNDD